MFGLDLGLHIDVFTVLDILVLYPGFGLGLSLAMLTGLSGFSCTQWLSHVFYGGRGVGPRAVS